MQYEKRIYSIDSWDHHKIGYIAGVGSTMINEHYTTRYFSTTIYS